MAPFELSCCTLPQVSCLCKSNAAGCLGIRDEDLRRLKKSTMERDFMVWRNVCFIQEPSAIWVEMRFFRIGIVIGLEE